jgi:hypothetical protein
MPREELMPREGDAVERAGGRALLAALALSVPLLAPASASAELPAVAMRFADPPPVTLDAMTLGRATHRVRVLVSNTGRRPVSLASPVLRFTPIRDGIAYACETEAREETRWPRSLEPRESIEVRHGVTCNTPFPGRYEVQVHARSESEPAEAARAVGTFALVVEAGASAPVRLPWDSRLWAVASGNREIRPGRGARVIVALVNGTPRDVDLAPGRAVVRVFRKDDGALVCPERVIDVPFEGTLAPGRTQAIATALPCSLTAEGAYDVAVALLGKTDSVALPRHVVRVASVATPPQPPAGGIIGGR